MLHNNLLLLAFFFLLASGATSISQQYVQSIFDDKKLLTEGVKDLLNYGYHDTTESLAEALNKLAKKYQDNAESFIVGQSIGNNPILGLKITSSTTTISDETNKQSSSIVKPGFVILGGIHGDHALGHELALHLGAFLLDRSNTDDRIKNLINQVDLYIIPTLNPDGFQKAREGDCFSAIKDSGRKNLAGQDLDTDFQFHNYKDISEVLAKNKLQPETKALLDWLVTVGKKVQMFVTLRTGLTGITYPFDETPNQITEHTYIDHGASLSPNAALDKPLFEYLGHEVYYSYQPNPITSNCNPLANNITVLDGAQIGSTYGTLSDFLYKFTNIFPINIYLDCCKFPSKQQLESKWLLHANSLFGLLESSKLGIRGVVTDIDSKKPISNARIRVSGFGKNVATSETGEYWRPLPPGEKYDVYVEADGYKVASEFQIEGSRVDGATGLATPVIVNFSLKLLNAPSSASGSKDSAGLIDVSSENNQGELEKVAVSLENLPTTSVLKPRELFKDVDEQVQRLDFKTPTDLQKHHHYDEMIQVLKNLNEQYPKISRIYDIGQSVRGRKLWVLEISNSPGHHQLLKPEFRYIANMHGNEVVGRELLLNLAKLLLENYGTNSLVTALINSTRVHLLPSMNPDGYELSKEGDCESETGRPNARNYDLNRNFPDRFGENLDNSIRQPEVEAVMRWSKEYQFTLGANLHGGSLVANYPYDGNQGSKDGMYEAAPDDNLFVHLAKTYSTNHPTMSRGEHCFDICGGNKDTLLNERFEYGITNGAKWYVLYGGIQDWVYLNTNCFSITVELGCRKFPLAKDMPRYWSDNKKPLIKYMLEAHRGIYGVVLDQNNRPIANATINIKSNEHQVYSTQYGDYWRLLLPGEYSVSVSKENYRTAHRTVTVGKYGSPAVRLDFFLSSGPKDLPSNVVNILSESVSTEGSETQASGKQSNKFEVELINGDKEAKLSEHGVREQDNLHSQSKTPTQNPINNSLPLGGAQILSGYQDTRYMLALCFIIVLPSVVLLVYMFGMTDGKRYPYKFGFSRLATSTEELEADEDDEGTRFMKRPARGARFSNLNDGQASDSEDELYSVDTWNK